MSAALGVKNATLDEAALVELGVAVGALVSPDVAVEAVVGTVVVAVETVVIWLDNEPKILAALAPTVSLVPFAIADELAKMSLPAVTVVPPVLVSVPDRVTLPEPISIRPPAPL